MAPDDINYEALAEHLTDHVTEIREGGTILHGAEAAAAGRTMLLEAFGSEEALDASMVCPGRPHRGEAVARGSSSPPRAAKS